MLETIKVANKKPIAVRYSLLQENLSTDEKTAFDFQLESETVRLCGFAPEARIGKER